MMQQQYLPHLSIGQLALGALFRKHLSRAKRRCCSKAYWRKISPNYCSRMGLIPTRLCLSDIQRTLGRPAEFAEHHLDRSTKGANLEHPLYTQSIFYRTRRFPRTTSWATTNN